MAPEIACIAMFRNQPIPRGRVDALHRKHQEYCASGLTKHLFQDEYARCIEELASDFSNALEAGLTPSEFKQKAVHVVNMAEDLRNGRDMTFDVLRRAADE